MTALFWFAICLVLIWLVAVAASWLLRSLGVAVRGLGVAGGLGISKVLGVLGKSESVKIHEAAKDLLAIEKKLASRDEDKENLKSYKPVIVQPEPLQKVEYVERLPRLFRRVTAPASMEVDIAGVRGLQNIGEYPAYVELKTISGEPSPLFPLSKPRPNIMVRQPPTWKEWRCSEADYEVVLPVYVGLLRPLNYFVNKSFKRAIEQSRILRARQLAAIEGALKRNNEVRSLHRDACENFEAAQRVFESLWAHTAAEHESLANDFMGDYADEKRKIDELVGAAELRGAAGLLARVEQSLTLETLPDFVPAEFSIRLDEESKIFILEHKYPDLGGVRWVKQVELKSGVVFKTANRKEIKEAAAHLYPILCLRLACEVARLDYDNLFNAIVINGWADYAERSTGQMKRAYCASMFATKDQLLSLNLKAADPVAAFSALKGVAARSLELTPVAPILRLNTQDRRFVEAKDVLEKMAESQNLAAMDWEDFEHLCRQLFELAFAGSGAEVKVTQASRDQGVDAVIFDPDVIRGGKIVVQAKRYTNIVDVSAVRDLYGAVINEGATKGILVTTSFFGPDAYGFAKDKPITLLNGEELLGLLDKFGYKFRIDLAEAKRLNSH
jgi:HJR/Mrr/RecB family endonuclease